MSQVAQARPAVPETLWSEGPAPERTDQQLLQGFHSETVESAEAAFATLIERHGPIVHRVCLDILGNLHDAQDAAQAVFLVLARKARSIRKPESLGPWLHGVALRVARQARRQAARRSAAERRIAETSCQRHRTACEPEPMDHDDLHEEINRLPEKYRLPIILCYLQGRTQPQAAQMLGWPLGTVQIRLHRGRERLRSRLTRTGSGLLALTASDLARMASATGAAFDRAWIETTARAGVRFASGKATAGLVAPPVAGLATLVLKAMVVDSVKTVALIVITLLCVAAGLTLSWLSAPDVSGQISLPDRNTATAAPTLIPQPTRIAAAPRASIEIGDQTDRSRPSNSPAGSETKSAGQTAASTPGLSALAPLPSDSRINDATPAEPLARSSDQSRNLALLDRRSERSARLGRELFERAWTREDSRAHGGDGLGPVFNAESCVACHNLGGSGGAARSTGTSKSSPRPVATSPTTWASPIHSAWTSEPESSNTAWVASRRLGRAPEPQADPETRGLDPCRLPPFAKRGLAPLWHRSHLQRLARVSPRSPRPDPRPDLGAEPTTVIRRRADRRDPGRGNRGRREAAGFGLGSGQRTREPPQGWTHRPVRLEGTNRNSRGIRPLRSSR